MSDGVARPTSDLDRALERFQQTDLEWGGGLANHGPMAAEALCALGHPALIEGLVDVYAPRVPPRRSGERIPEDQREAALGDASRLPDWVATFEEELVRTSWRSLLEATLPRLLPGSFAGACHGLLRVAHAVRSVEAEDTPVRRRELALGLAYWAGRYQELPGVPGAARREGQGVRESFDALAPLPPPQPPSGLFFEAVRVLDDHADFARVVEGFDAAGGTALEIAGACAREGARLYLANPGARVAYVHCVTVPSALRLFGHLLAPSDAARAAGYLVQSALALHAVSRSESSAGSRAQEPAAPPSDEVLRLSGDPAEIRYRAACSIDEHAVKLAEACLREHAIAPDPNLLLAAADAAIHLDAGAGRGARC